MRRLLSCAWPPLNLSIPIVFQSNQNVTPLHQFSSLNSPEHQTSIFVDNDTRIQVLDSIAHLTRADKEQRGAFIRDERTLVVWTNSFDDIVPVFEEFEDKLTKMVWRNRPRFDHVASSPSILSATSSDFAEKATTAFSAGSLGLVVLPEEEETKQEKVNPEEEPVDPRIAKAEARKKQGFWSWKLDDEPKKKRETDVERAAGSKRPTRLYAPVYNGFAVALSICEHQSALFFL
jgi:hypothetical protein